MQRSNHRCLGDANQTMLRTRDIVAGRGHDGLLVRALDLEDARLP